MTIEDVLLRLIIEEPTSLDTGCWIAPWRPDSTGHVSVRIEGKTKRVHKVVYERFRGPVPAGKELHHRCENKWCANFEHVDPLTRKEHAKQHDSAAAIHSAKTHCPKGHPYAGHNLIVEADGDRRCRECRRQRVSLRAKHMTANERLVYNEAQRKRYHRRRHAQDSLAPSE